MSAGTRPLRAVFFDLDDTLCDDASAWLLCARHCGDLALQTDPAIDSAALTDAFLEISRQYWSSPECAQETRPLSAVRTEQWGEALAGIGANRHAALAEALATEYARQRIAVIALFPDALATIETLKARGLALALITNGYRATHVEKIAHLGLDRLFDHVLIADIVGCFKPNCRIFQRALELCGCMPDEAAMVGDDLDNDIAGAEAVGIRSFWFNPNGAALPLGAKAPSGGSIGALSELPGLLF